MIDFKTKLDELLENGRITKDEYKRFRSRGIQYEKFSDYPNLQKFFPDGVPIGASEDFIENLEFPYQETSYLCASSGEFSKMYLYKSFGEGGGVLNLTGRKRPIGDNIFASLNRIMLGNKAILISADNLIANLNQIWDWNFFGNNLKDKNSGVYDDLEKFAQKKLSHRHTQVILARKRETFERLDILEKFKQNKIAIFNNKDTDVIILTNQDGFEYASKIIEPDEKINYISATDAAGAIDIKKCLIELRKKFEIKKMLNDGGRKMSDGMRNLNLLGGERVSYEPFPGKKFMPNTITNDMILGKEGEGLDDSEINKAFVVFSQKINTDRHEVLKLHLYPI